MQLVCLACQAAYSGVSHCPKCGARLISAHESGVIIPNKKRQIPPPLIEPTASGRVVLGVLVSFGVYLGLREWCVAWVSQSDMAQDSWWDSSNGQWGAMLLRTLATGVGGFVAGASRNDGWILGFFSGAITGGCLLASDIATKPVSPGFVAFFTFGMSAFLALITAWYAAVRWPAITPIATVKGGSRGSSLLRLVQEEDNKRKHRPTQWWRLVIAISIAISGVVAADEIRIAMMKGSRNILNMGSSFSSPLVCLELAMAVSFLAGVFVGAGTGAGLRHGLVTGAVVATTIVSLTVSRDPEIFPSVEGFFWVLEIPLETMRNALPQAELFMVLWTTIAAGGWFGGTLLPPLGSAAQRRRVRRDA